MKATAMNLSALFDHMQGRTVHTARVASTDAPHIRRCLKAGLAMVTEGVDGGDRLLVLTDEALALQKEYEAKRAPQVLERAERELSRVMVMQDRAQEKQDATELAWCAKVVLKYTNEVNDAKARIARMEAKQS